MFIMAIRKYNGGALLRYFDTLFRVCTPEGNAKPISVAFSKLAQAMWSGGGKRAVEQ